MAIGFGPFINVLSCLFDRSVRFTQQLVLFAPQAVTVHSHVKILLSTLSSRQPTLRHLAVSTLRHLIEKDPVCNTYWCCTFSSLS